MRVAGYIRANGLDELSLDEQRRGVEELADREGWQLVEMYAEQEESAHFDSAGNRPALNSMLDDAAQGRFDLLVTHTIDRLSRNMQVAMQTFKTLSDHNVRYRAVAQNIDDATPEGYLHMVILGAFAWFFEERFPEHN